MFRVFLVVVAMLVVGGGLRWADAVAQEPLSISGTVWFDVNRDGERQAEDYGFRGRLVLRSPGGTTSITQTDVAGRYMFNGLAPGNYVVVASDSPASQLIMTFPTLRVRGPLAREVTLTDSPAVGIDFGVHRPSELPVFVGLAYLNAAPADFPQVRALVDGVDCTFPASILPTDLDRATYQISVLSSDLVDGCGDAGDAVTFTVNGLPANETAVWTQAPAGPAPPQGRQGVHLELDLTVGPPFASFYVGAFGAVQASDQGRRFGPVVALVDGNVCGAGSSFGERIIVPPRELVAGCGYEGAVVSFAVTGLLAEETVFWSGGLSADIRLTVDPAPGSPLAGPPFAYFRLELPAGAGATATMGDTHCGSAAANAERGLAVVAVAPDELDKGCGFEGAPLKINVYQKGVVVAQVDAEWQAGQFQDIEWQAPAPARDGPGVRPPSVGDGGLRR